MIRLLPEEKPPEPVRTVEPRAWLPDKPRDPESIDPGFRSIIRAALDGLKNWPLVMLGEAGSGKSCASLCVLDHVGGFYSTLAELCDTVALCKRRAFVWRGTHAEWRPTEAEYWDWFATRNMFVIDEVGETKDAPEPERYGIKKALDYREGKPLIVISNRSLEELGAVYGDPVASRMAAGTVLEFAGDRRIERART